MGEMTHIKPGKNAFALSQSTLGTWMQAHLSFVLRIARLRSLQNGLSSDVMHQHLVNYKTLTF